LILLLLFIPFWLFIRRPRYVLISIIPLLLGWKSIAVFFAFHASDDFTNKKPANTLRVVHWNVARFVEWKRNNNKGSQTRLKMMDLIKAQNADVLCLQEFFHSTDSVYYDNLNYLMKNLGYPYFHYSWDNDGWLQYNGQVIFSRHPIIDSSTIRFPRPGMEESLLEADIVFGSDTVRVFTTHLQSVQFRKEDFQDIEEIKSRDDSLLENSKNIFSKLKRAAVYRSRQANIVHERIKQSPHPCIVTGDFNDVPNSYTYFKIRGNLQDAFLKKGFGVGRTYSGLSPTLRIDYILPGKQFEVVQFKRIINDYSDHYMLVTDLKL
jgi:endonuclease/exonuclease/phosphatase family metal-dependent hydrolase